MTNVVMTENVAQMDIVMVVKIMSWGALVIDPAQIFYLRRFVLVQRRTVIVSENLTSKMMENRL